MLRIQARKPVLGGKGPRFVDSVKERRKRLNSKHVNIEALNKAESIWNSFSAFRFTRRRNMRYGFDDQWGDKVWNGKRYVTERERIQQKTGAVALQNNHLFKIINSVAGTYVKSKTKPVVFARQANADDKAKMMTNALQTNYDNNEEHTLLQDAIYEMILGGMPIFREEWASHRGEMDSYTYKVNPDYFAFESKGNDPRLEWDTSMIVELRDYLPGELVAELMRWGVETDIEEVKKLYGIGDEDWLAHYRQVDIEELTFRWATQSSLCRTYHVWTQEYKTRYRVYDPLDDVEPLYKIEASQLETIIAINEERRQACRAQGIVDDADMPLINYGQIEDENGNKIKNLGKIVDQYWHFQMLTPEGHVLAEFDSPYDHGMHPYVWTAHHYINGKIYPFISVILDQQRYINRLITLHDMCINAAAKGLKMIPKSVLGNMSPKEFAKQFVEIGGFIFYEDDPTRPNQAKPEVISTNATNIGTAELLKLEVDFISDISAVSGALQGATPQSGTSASRYALEMQNSTTSISSLFTRFNAFEQNLAQKKMDVIHQYYTDARNVSVAHGAGYTEFAMYEPKMVQDLKYMVRVEQSAETPVARMAMNELLETLVQSGQIGIKQMLKHGYYPGANDLLLDIEAQEQAMQQQGAGGGAVPGISEAVQQQVNDNVLDKTKPQIVKEALMGA